MPVLFGRLAMGPVLAEYLRRWPEVTLDARYADRAVDLIEDGVDCAVRVGALEDSSLVARRLATFRRILVAAPDYLARAGMPATPADLARHHAVRFVAQGDAWPLVSGIVPARGRILAQDGGAVLDLAIHGVGIALVPDWQAAAPLAEGRLRLVLPDHPTAPIPIHAVFPEARLLSAKVRAFVDLCVAHLVRAPDAGAG
jgi:DNA-binding transcriptional LysR family regulator